MNFNYMFRNFTNAIITEIDNFKNLFYEENVTNEEVPRLIYREPEHRKLGIFKTKFGQVLEEYLYEFCQDSLILDDLVIVNNQKNEKRVGNSKNKKNQGINNELSCENVEYLEKYILIKGNLQSGKTKFMIGAAIKQLMFGKSAIIMFRNITNDHIQTKQRLELCINEFIRFAERNGVNKEQFLINIKIFDELTNLEEIDKMITANPPIICILISNENRMKRISNRLPEFQEKDINYTLFIDEVDCVDSTFADIRKEYINRLKHDASLVVGVSATILGTYVEWDLKPICIRELSVPENYVGILDLKSIFKDTGFNQVSQKYKINRIFETVPCLKDYLQEIGNGNLNNELCFENQAMIDLVSITHMIKPQKCLFKYMINTYPNVASIIMVETGIKVYHPSLGNKSLTLNGCTSNFDNNCHHFSSKNDIGSILRLLELKGVQNIKNIVIFAGNKASRAITFSSSGIVYKTKEESMRRWHVKRALIKFSKDITQDEAMQRAGRLCGIFEYGSKQILCANLKDLEIVKKAYHVQEDILDNTARKYGSMIKEDIKVNTSENARISAAFTWKYNNEISADLILGGHHLIDNLELSLWKTRVTKKTPTGRSKTSNVDITNRDSVHPICVPDDGRHKEEEFEFKEKTTGIVEDNVNIGNADVPEKAIKRFRKWKLPSSTAIHKFSNTLISSKIYKHDEITNLLKVSGYEQPESMLNTMLSGRENFSFTKYLLIEINKNYKLNDKYKELWDSVFITKCNCEYCNKDK